MLMGTDNVEKMLYIKHTEQLGSDVIHSGVEKWESGKLSHFPT